MHSVHDSRPRIEQRVISSFTFFCLSFLKGKMDGNLFPSITVQYRPSEKEIVFGLKVPSSDGLGLIL